MMTSRLRTAAFLKSHQNPDGGWGYAPRRRSLVEPTAFAVLALQAGNETAAAGRGLGFLRTCVTPSGAIGLDPRDTEGNWMAYAALLAFHALGAAEEERRVKAWILAFEDASGRFSRSDIAEISTRFRYDASIPGWAWTPRTTAWIEPTALFILALRGAGVPAADKRIRSGIALILDRRVPSGGWNFGNPFSKGYELEATAMSTSLALAALGAAGVAAKRPEVAAGFRYLEGELDAGISTASLAWMLLASRHYPGIARRASGAASLLASLQAGDGGFRDNIFETALASLVLEDAASLKPAAGRIP
ncbi:MAG: terpene cyclase/mutase family protein [Acidobacteria bacterium]|nr:terpene cyclase/mutase family protein [Acidobacteriota bacterium]